MLVNAGYTPKQINEITNPSVLGKVKNSPFNNPFTRGIARTAAYMYNPAIAGVELRQLMQAKDLYDRTRQEIMDPNYEIDDITLGLTEEYANGGIAGLRQGYVGGGGVDIARRGFLKLLGVTAGGVAALKLGLGKILGKESGAVSKKVIDEVIIEGGSGAPSWLQPLVNKALREGTDISKQAVKDGQVVKSLDTPTGKVDVYYDTRTGEIDIDYIGGNTAMGESVNMRYVPGVADEGTKGVKPKDQFEAVESIPEFQGGNYADGPDLGFGENSVSEVKDLYSDLSELQALGGDKALINDISVTLQKKKILKEMDNNPQEFAQDMEPDVYYDD